MGSGSRMEDCDKFIKYFSSMFFKDCEKAESGNYLNEHGDEQYLEFHDLYECVFHYISYHDQEVMIPNPIFDPEADDEDIIEVIMDLLDCSERQATAHLVKAGIFEGS